MQGDDLAVFLFWMAIAVTFGLETVKAETAKRRKAFGAVAVACLIAGLAWHQISQIWPSVTAPVTSIATNPVSWFAIIMFIAAIFAFHRPRRAGDNSAGNASQTYDDNPLQALINDLQQKQALLEATITRAKPDSDKLRQLDRTAFLLTTAAADAIFRRRLEDALAEVPMPPTDLPINTHEKMTRETDRLQKYLQNVGASLSGSQWGPAFMSNIRMAENEAESELLRMDPPTGLHPAHFRLFHIACTCRDHTQVFLERAIADAKIQERSMLQMLRERPEIHKDR